jgi:hypothetical protein
MSIIDGNYAPSYAPERAFFDSLWKYANPSGDEILSGQSAVQFLQKSELDVGILREASFDMNHIP